MQQWDALHAMLLYEILEFRESRTKATKDWKGRPQVRGLSSPFLLKVAVPMPDIGSAD